MDQMNDIDCVQGNMFVHIVPGEFRSCVGFLVNKGKTSYLHLFENRWRRKNPYDS